MNSEVKELKELKDNSPNSPYPFMYRSDRENVLSFNFPSEAITLLTPGN